MQRRKHTKPRHILLRQILSPAQHRQPLPQQRPLQQRLSTRTNIRTVRSKRVPLDFTRFVALDLAPILPNWTSYHRIAPSYGKLVGYPVHRMHRSTSRGQSAILKPPAAS